MSASSNSTVRAIEFGGKTRSRSFRGNEQFHGRKHALSKQNFERGRNGAELCSATGLELFRENLKKSGAGV